MTVKLDLTELERLESKAVKNLNQGIISASLFLEGEIKFALAGQRPPLPRRVDTGRLMNSITTSNVAPMECVVWTNIEYSPYIEFGTTRINPGRHFSYMATVNAEKMTKIVGQQVIFG